MPVASAPGLTDARCRNESACRERPTASSLSLGVLDDAGRGRDHRQDFEGTERVRASGALPLVSTCQVLRINECSHRRYPSNAVRSPSKSSSGRAPAFDEDYWRGGNDARAHLRHDIPKTARVLHVTSSQTRCGKTTVLISIFARLRFVPDMRTSRTSSRTGEHTRVP